MMAVLALAIVVILVALVMKLTVLANSVRTLERHLHEMQRTLSQLTAAGVPVQSTPPSVAVPREPVLWQTPAPASSAPAAAAPVQPVVLHSEKVPSRTREEFEAFVGGKLLNRIGALALVIGVGFFLKYAFDNNWITETMRVVIGSVLGVGILAGGIRTHKKGFEVFAQGLFGAGISILYLSAYASFNFYHLLPQTAAFGFMSLVTICGFVIAVRYDSLAISLLAWMGGFLTPFLLSTGSANEIGLFTYVAVLEAGLLALVMKKPSWAILGPLTLAGTYLVFYLWGSEYYTDDAIGVTLLFVSLFWLLLYVTDLYQTLRRTETSAAIRQVMSLLNAVAYYCALYSLIDAAHHEWMGAASLLLSLAYFLQVILVWKSTGPSSILAQNILVTLLLIVIATAIQFAGFTTAIFWSLEAILVVWCARRWNLQYVAFFAFGLLSCAVVQCSSTSGAFGYIPLSEFTPLWNDRALAFVVLAASFAASAGLLRHLQDRRISQIAAGLPPAWVVILLTCFTVEVNDYFMLRSVGASVVGQDSLYFAKFMSMACVWMAYSLPLVYVGIRKQYRPVLIPGLLIIVLSFWLALFKGVVYSPIENFSPLLNIRSLALLLVIAGMAAHWMWLRRSESRQAIAPEIPAAIAPEVPSAIALAALLLLLGLLTGETRDMFELLMFKARGLSSGLLEEQGRLENLQQLSLSGLWMLYGGVLMGIGIWKRHRSLRVLAISLLGIAVVKIFIYDLSFLEALYRIFSFIGLGLILLAASYVYQKYRAIIFEDAGEKGAGEKDAAGNTGE